MRFCLASGQANWGGGERLIWSLRCELLKAGHQVAWVVRQGEPLHQLVLQAGDTILATHRGRGIHPGQWSAVGRGLRQWLPDALLMNDSHAIMLAGSAALACGRARPLRLAFRHVTFPIRSPLKLRLMADHVICVSAAAQATVLAAGFRPECTHLIYGGVEVPVPDPTARQWAERELGLTADTPLLVCIGNLLECKGHIPLIEAAALVQQQLPEFRLAIAGEGPLRDSLVRRIQELRLDQTVQLLGFRQDADRWLQAASVLVHPSLQEGLSLVLIQAQMLEKLIVSTGVGGSSEVLGLQEAQPCRAWLARPGEPTSLAEQMLAATRRWQTERNARSTSLTAELQWAAQRARNKFDIQQNMVQLVQLVQRLKHA